MDGAMGRKRKRISASTAAVVAVMVLSAHSVSVSAAVDVQADSLWNAGVEAYADGRWQDARQAWSGIEALGLESKELYYNIGNACFKQDDPAHAILYFERALRLDPSYDDARFNLEYANSMIQDKIESVPEFFLISWTRSLSMIPGRCCLWCCLPYALPWYSSSFSVTLPGCARRALVWP